MPHERGVAPPPDHPAAPLAPAEAPSVHDLLAANAAVRALCTPPEPPAEDDPAPGAPRADQPAA
jgi:hypothetical protein